MSCVCPACPACVHQLRVGGDPHLSSATSRQSYKSAHRTTINRAYQGTSGTPRDMARTIPRCTRLAITAGPPPTIVVEYCCPESQMFRNTHNNKSTADVRARVAHRRKTIRLHNLAASSVRHYLHTAEGCDVTVAYMVPHMLAHVRACRRQYSGCKSPAKNDDVTSGSVLPR